MTISFSSSNLRDDATSGNGDYRLDKLPETTPIDLGVRPRRCHLPPIHGTPRASPRHTAGGARG